MFSRLVQILVKLFLSLLVIPFLVALFRAVQVSFSESAEYGFLRIVARGNRLTQSYKTSATQLLRKQGFRLLLHTSKESSGC